MVVVVVVSGACIMQLVVVVVEVAVGCGVCKGGRSLLGCLLGK